MAVPRIIVTTHDGTAKGDLDPTQISYLATTGEVNGERSLTVTTTEELSKNDRLLYKDGRGYWHEYVVEGIEADHDTPGGVVCTYWCPWSLQHDLSCTIVYGMPGTGGTPATARTALTAALAGTDRWRIGTVGISTTGSASFWRLSGWEAMQKLVEVWGGEVEVSITVDATGVAQRSVSLLSKVGQATATRRFDYGHDVRSIRRTVHDQLWTGRVVPLGAGEETESGGYGRKITIESVNNNVDYLANSAAETATRVPDGDSGWEYPVQVIENPECKTPADLLSWAQSVLEDYTTPKVSYEADVVQLERAGLDPLGVSVGDEVAVVDTTFGDEPLRLTARVMRIEEDLLDPAATMLTISNLQDSLAGTLDSMASATGTNYNMIVGMSANQGTGTYVSNLISRINAQANATGGYTYFTEGDGIRTYDTPVTDPLVGAEASKVVEVRGGTIRIANTKDSGGNWEWKTLIVSGLVAAECVAAMAVLGGGCAQIVSDGLQVLDDEGRVVAQFGYTSNVGLVVDQTSINTEVNQYGFSIKRGYDYVFTLLYDNEDPDLTPRTVMNAHEGLWQYVEPRSHNGLQIGRTYVRADGSYGNQDGINASYIISADSDPNGTAMDGISHKAAIYISGGYAFYSTGTASGDQLTLPSVTVDDPFDDTKSFQLGKPERKTANASRYISTASIDTYTDGPSVTLGPGRWMITGTVNFGSASGSRNMCARFSMGGTAYAEQQRVYAAYGNYATLNVSCDYTNNTGSDVTVTLQGSSSKTISSDNAATWYIVATRLQ